MEATPQVLADKLLTTLEKQGRSPADNQYVREAYDFALKAHAGQFRKSEEPYIIHPIEVATILTDLIADRETIAAGLLHDVLEDCDVKPQEIEDKFGPGVRTIVEGVTKLGKFSFSSKEERQAENFRKLIVAIAEDIRVVLVKLADRLHNMRTLDYMLAHKQIEKARETLEIYAPLANRFGLGRIKWELEDLSLKYLHPDEFDHIQKLVVDSREARQQLITQVVENLKGELSERGIQAEIMGRPKHLFGIWKKMKTQQKTFEELYDVLAIRIIIDSNENKNYCELKDDPDTQKCYEVMGLLHSIFRPIPGRVKDFIGMPKANSYQSLHTAVVGPKGKPLEIQIRTRRMHHIAEYGIAAHWKYKETGDEAKADSGTDRKLAWLRQLVEWQSDLRDATEYLDTVKMDLFSDEVFVFSPRGDVFDLPVEASPIDFAYRVHTDIGNRCVGARINDRIVPLNSMLKNGDIVEIITSKNAHPTLDWLNFAKTHQAKNRIRQWFKRNHREENIQRGRQMLEAELGRAGLEEFLKSDKLKEVGKKVNLTDPEDILAAVGYGDLSLAQIINRLREQEQLAKKTILPATQAEKPRNIGSLSGLMHHLAKCCQPVPGEEVEGVVTRGSGISVHRNDCVSLLKVDPGRRMVVDWSQDNQTTYPAALQIECLDRVGVANDILEKVSALKVNLADVRVDVHKETRTATIKLVLEVKDIQQLTHIFQSISRISDVLRVKRQEHRRKPSSRSSNVTPLKLNDKPVRQIIPERLDAKSE